MKALIIISFAIALASCKSGQEAVMTNSDQLPQDVVSSKESELTATFIEAASEKTKGNFDRALSLLNKCVSLNDKDAAIYFELSKVYANLANLSASMDNINKAIELDDQNIWYHIHKANIFQYSNLNKEAAEVYESIVKLDDNPDYLVNYAENLVYAGEYEKAVNVFSQLQQKMGTTPEIVNQIYQLHVELGKTEKGIEVIKQASEESPNEIAYKGMLAEAYEKSGDLEKSIAVYKDILKSDPNNPRVHLALFKYYDFKKQPDKANASLRAAFKSEDLGIDDKMQILILMYEDLENNPELIEDIYPLLDILVETHPEEAKAHSMYGDFLLQDGDKKGARDQFVQALSFDPEKFIIWNQVMFLDLETNDFDALLNHSQEALELYPNQPGVYYFNGVALHKKKRHEESIDMLQNGLGILIDNPVLEKEFYQALGDAHYHNNSQKDAFKFYDKALIIEPNNPYILNNYAYYLALDNQEIEKAAAMSKKANELAPNKASYTDTYGWILFKMKNYPDAKTQIENALELGGNSNPIIVEHMGDVYYMLGDKAAALKYWKEAKSIGDGSVFLNDKISQEKYVH